NPNTFTTHDQAPGLRLVGPDDEPRPRAKLGRAWTADELMDTEFPPARWAVPGVLCEGVNLLCGPPKVGKSWMSLNLGISVAAGNQAFDAIPVEPGPVLYLALEDVPRRLQTRVAKMLPNGQRAPRDLHLVTECPPMTHGGDEAIAGWLDAHRNARMVVIDVFAKVRGQSPMGASAYDADYLAVGRIKKIADAYGVAILLVHHVRKQGSDDFLAEVSGTNGIAGAADATLVLKRSRGEADGTLYVTGRDVDESEYALRFYPEVGAWSMLDGPPAEYAMGDSRATILRWLRTNGPAAPRAIEAGTGLAYNTVKKTCQRMLADAQLHADASGTYRAADESGTA
ncbi:AAA family ATPase, partial [Luedemannella helvata]|uniref:AAA family ATPase n=1 Tax=Luedemannella helvata TaxID=349315 RepID=UPI003CD0A763